MAIRTAEPVVADRDAVLRDPNGVNRRVRAGRPVPPSLVVAYRELVGDDDTDTKATRRPQRDRAQRAPEVDKAERAPGQTKTAPAETTTDDEIELLPRRRVEPEGEGD